MSKMIKDNNIDICCIQECEILKDYPSNILSFKNYNLEVENNSIKARCCIYIRGGISYVRRDDLEGVDSNLVIIEAKTNAQIYLIINLYRSFSMQGDVTPEVRFVTQINTIKSAISR